jgi:toxin ParE2
MKITFLEEAQYELDDAIDYYNFEAPGLGEQFLQEILNSLDRIVNYQGAWHPYPKILVGAKPEGFLMA